jgi:hypothetical protein
VRRLRIPLTLGALVGGGVLATLLVLEIGVRAIGAFDRNSFDRLAEDVPVQPGRELRMADLIRRSNDDRIVYELRPRTHGLFLGYEVRINTLGMRDRPRSAAKRSSVFRILALGDSHLFGWGVGQEESFAPVLESLLAVRALGRFEVLNAGVPGYNTVMEARVFERRAEELAPDLVVIHYVDNDMDLPNFLAKPTDPWTLRHSYLAELVRRRLALLGGADLMPNGLFVAALDPDTGRYRIPDDRIPERYRPLQGWDRMVEAYRRLAALARARNIPYAVLVHWDDYGPRLAGQVDDVLPERVRVLKRILAAQGYIVIDPQDRVVEILRRQRLPVQALWITPTDTHMSRLYHRIAAREILERLDGASVLPTTPSGATTDPTRPGHQSQDREGARTDDPAVGAPPSSQGD